MNKHFLQKVAIICGRLSIATSLTCAGILLYYLDNSSDVFRSSMGAVVFFFFVTGLLLNTLGNANLPNLKPDLSEDKK